MNLKEDRKKAILRRQYTYLKCRHKKNSMAGRLMTFENFYKISFEPCKYCNSKYSKIACDKSNVSNIRVKINGIDRVNSSVGYTKKNSVSCCSVCNYAKHQMTTEEFFKWIKRVHKFNKL